MKTWQQLSWPVAVLLSLLGPALSQNTNMDTERAVVVKLQAHFPKRGDETAAGMFVGTDQKYAYFVTARHAVIYIAETEADAQPVPAKSVKLQFFGSPQSVDASIFQRFDPVLDLAVVYVPLAGLPPNLPQIVKKDAVVNTPVWVVGHPSAGDWSVWGGTVTNENAPEGDSHHFTTTSNPSLAHGYSGGPEFDSAGNFLGLQVKTEATYGIAAKVAEIVAQLKAWQVPLNNISEESDTEAIKRLLGLYTDAYNQQDSNALWKIWPTAPTTLRSVIERSFAGAISIEMHLQMQDPKPSQDGVGAIVRGRFSQTYVPRQGNRPPRKDGDITFVLKKSAGIWTISEVR